MTRNQITKKLEKANISTDGLEITTDEVEVYVSRKDGEFSQRLTDIKAEKVSNALGFGGYQCQHGGWVLQNNYKSKGEYSDPSSAWHY